MLDNVYTLVILYTSMNLPIAVWMMRSFLAEVPEEILEAAQVDGAGLSASWLDRRADRGARARGDQPDLLHLQLERVHVRGEPDRDRASTAPIFLVGFISSQGLFLAKLCAAATLVSLPVLIAGFAAQDKLVRGLSLGAVK